MSAPPTIEPFFDPRTGTLSYLVFDEASKDAVIIDPVLDYEPAGGRLFTESLQRLADRVDAQGLTVHLVLETHPHADHLSGAQWLKARTGAKVAVSARITELQAIFSGVFNREGVPTDGRQFDRLLEDGEVLEAGTLRLTALATPGHTPACMSFELGDAVFTGDALFLDDVGVGRCDFPKGSADALYDSVTNVLFARPAETRLFVGHDYPPRGRGWRAMTTVGSARAANVQLSGRTTKADFVTLRTARDRTLDPPRLLYPAVQVNLDGGNLPAPASNGRRYLVTPLHGP